MRIVHLGLGVFHRAHQAVYLQRLIDAGETAWELVAGNIHPGQEALEAALQAQGGQYTLETVKPGGERAYQRITAIRRVETEVDALTDLAADASTRIVSFTVTEAGYEPGPDNALYRTLSAILQQRRARGSGPVTLLCCDNLRHNGDRSRAGLLAFIADADLRAWVEANTSSPNAMVDRITPRPPADLRERVRNATGWSDAAPVMAEHFIQWVIEDRFCNGRPEWERVGVTMVDDVAPFEEAKIRILNASHSGIAWAGSLMGLRFIHEAVADPRLRAIAHAYVSEDVIPCLQLSPLDLAAYRDAVLERFGNAALADTCQRVCADGFAKLPGFIAPTIRERLAQGQGIASVAMLPALFLAFLQRWHRSELAEPYQDQAMDPAIAHAICGADDPVLAFAQERSLWSELAGDARLVEALRAARLRVESLLA